VDRIGPEDPEQAASGLEWIQRLYEEEGGISPLPRDRTGGLRFRQGVPDALLHLSRNNLSALERLWNRLEREKRQAVVAAGRFGEPGHRAALASVLYWHAPDVPAWFIAESLGLGPGRVRSLAEENPTAIVRCLDCDQPIRPQGRYHFQEMLSAAEEFNKDPQLLRSYLYTGLHCEDCALEREDRWGEEWARQEREYQQRLLELRTMPYQEYLRTPEWRRRRERKLDQADLRCQFCNRHHRSLNVHHRTYENLGEELDGDLIVLCRACHSTFHKHRRLGR
jgi:hypothetical protein